jgi:hypothetical protein
MRSVSAVLVSFVGCFVFLSGCSGREAPERSKAPSTPPAAKAGEEQTAQQSGRSDAVEPEAGKRRWARNIAEKFVEYLRAGRGREAASLMKKSSRERIEKEARAQGYTETAAWARLLWELYGDELLSQFESGNYPKYASWSIESELLAPNGREVAFQGRFSGGTRSPQTVRFDVVVARDEETDSWLVTSFVVIK